VRADADVAAVCFVDGNPLEDITILQDINKITAVMKNGEFHRAPVEPTPATPANGDPADLALTHL
jgi:hypothetical protein